MQLGQSIWIASRKEIPNAKIPKYEKPREIKLRLNFFTIMPASVRGGLEVMKHGENVFNTWIGTANARHFYGQLKEGDLLWIDGHFPNREVEEKYGHGASANAMIKSVLPANLTLSLVIVNNPNQVKR